MRGEKLQTIEVKMKALKGKKNNYKRRLLKKQLENTNTDKGQDKDNLQQP